MPNQQLKRCPVVPQVADGEVVSFTMVLDVFFWGLYV